MHELRAMRTNLGAGAELLRKSLQWRDGVFKIRHSTRRKALKVALRSQRF